MRSYLTTAAVAVALSACASAPATPPSGSNLGLETLHSAAVDSFGLRIRAATNGCTREDSFRTEAYQDGVVGETPRYVVAFVRKEADPCPVGATPRSVLLTYSLKDLGVPEDAVLAVANPVK